MKSLTSYRHAWCLVLIALSVCQVAVAQTDIQGMFCGSLENHYGPFDYTNSQERAQRLPIVERFHFTNEIATLTTTGRVPEYLGRNIAYTLHTFPNHHRALDAMSRLSIMQGRPHPLGARYTVDCYFERAIRWRPNDPTVRLVYGIHHYRAQRLDAAVRELGEALRMAPEDPEVHYNLGLAFLSKGDYAAARRHAVQAYERGYPLPGLRSRLERIGEWVE
ncbi:hypothetical protein B1C78_15555 [Thioalkalivibrio denitrificans]|uniref:Uncharacterized protein n=1 Tax=Thioalkalivibrio denitrificans TaxID=108003 RepID=A0A1V3NB41_9GAMM|nr:hypothetical protein B1C78_15555 [Thioalkalivibrio denitrificans]